MSDARELLAELEHGLEEATRHTHICGSCDAGLPMSCTCPAKDYHQVISELIDVVRRQNAALTAVLDLSDGYRDSPLSREAVRAITTALGSSDGPAD